MNGCFVVFVREPVLSGLCFVYASTHSCRLRGLIHSVSQHRISCYEWIKAASSYRPLLKTCLNKKDFFTNLCPILFNFWQATILKGDCHYKCKLRQCHCCCVLLGNWFAGPETISFPVDVSSFYLNWVRIQGIMSRLPNHPSYLFNELIQDDSQNISKHLDRRAWVVLSRFVATTQQFTAYVITR